MNFIYDTIKLKSCSIEYNLLVQARLEVKVVSSCELKYTLNLHIKKSHFTFLILLKYCLQLQTVELQDL